MGKDHKNITEPYRGREHKNIIEPYGGGLYEYYRALWGRIIRILQSLMRKDHKNITEPYGERS